MMDMAPTAAPAAAPAADPADVAPATAGPARLLLTAEEAYPELERLFLGAETEIWGSFLVFDPATRLRSEAGRAVGDSWFDLIVHTLRRGVRLHLVLSDVDPAMRPAMHRGTWRAVRMFHAAADLAGAHDRMRIIPAMHASETGLVPRLAFWPLVLRKMQRTAGWLNRQDAAVRRALLREMPGVARRMRHGPDGQVRPRLWPMPRLFPGTHHQKLAVFDRQRLYIGGLDLNERRFDSPDHDRAPDQTWHDVQLLIDGGPAPAAAQAHLETFLDSIEGKLAPPPQAGLLRTLSRKRRWQPLHLGPAPVLAELQRAHLDAIAGADRLIYLETQYFRDRSLARALAAAARANPRLTLILMLPAAPDDLAFGRKTGLDVRAGEWLQARCLRKIGRAFGPRLFVGCPAQPRAWRRGHPTDRDRVLGAPIIYVHSKVSVFDDDLALVSSANLNGRSLRWDTEAGVALRGPQVAGLRRRLMAHWLPAAAPSGFFDPDRAVRAWRGLALQNARRPPGARQGFIVPYDVRLAERDGLAVPILPEELV